MNILVTGAGGFLGQKLVQKLLQLGEIPLGGSGPREIEKIYALDVALPTHIKEDNRLILVTGNLTESSFLQETLDKNIDLIFHLAAVVSGEAEKDFELGYRVNLGVVQNMLEHLRLSSQKPVIVFASSCAVFGGDYGPKITDYTYSTPESSYGTHKAIGDLLINDYSRRGWVDGRSLRLPTIAVRPGKANAATTSFISGIIREPLAGRRQNCPVGPSTEAWILSPNQVINHFIHAAGLPASSLGNNRMINLPGITVTINDMVTELTDYAGKATASLIDWNHDEFLQKIVLTFPTTFETPRADALGFKPNKNFSEIFKEYIHAHHKN